MHIALIAAMGKNRVIGKDNRLPWHLPEELKYFKKMTKGKPVIMGRKTLESMNKKPLPERHNIILSSDKNFLAEGCSVVHSVKEAIEAAGLVDEIMIIGGAKIFEAFLPRADKIYLSIIHQDYTGDTFFPEINLAEWNILNEEERDGFTTQILQRKK